MELIYRSTRNANETATASEAILKGLANEGGLFVPDDKNERRFSVSQGMKKIKIKRGTKRKNKIV